VATRCQQLLNGFSGVALHALTLLLLLLPLAMDRMPLVHRHSQLFAKRIGWLFLLLLRVLLLRRVLLLLLLLLSCV
jgi:hypothetical protein